MATDWSGRDAAITYFEKVVRDLKWSNDEDKELYIEALNALRRSQDHTAIQTKLRATINVLRDLVESCEHDTGAPWPALDAARVALGKPAVTNEETK